MERGGVFKERNFVCCYVIFSIIKRRTTTILRRNDEMERSRTVTFLISSLSMNYFTELLSVIDVGKMKNDNPLASELHKLTRRGSFQKADRM